MKGILYIVLDGLGDLPCEQLNNQTPLEAANTPHLDGLAEKGRTGLVYPVKQGLAPESDFAVISILGYSVDKYYTGRGPLECFAEGLRLEDGDLAYRVNFATLGKEQRIIDRRVGRNLTTEEASALSKEINSEVRLASSSASFQFKNTIGHRGVLVIRDRQAKLSGNVTNTDPAYQKEGVFGIAKLSFESTLLECKPMPGFEDSEEAIRAADLTNEFIGKSQEVLKDAEVNRARVNAGKLPANCVLTRDGGDRLPHFPKIENIYGIKFASLVEMPVEKGIALLTGMEVIELPPSRGEPGVDYSLRAQVAIEELKRFGGLYIHIKGPDEPAHDGDCQKKKESIEAIDRFFFGELLPKIDLKEEIIAVTSDHSTPCCLKSHSADPVPLLISGHNIQPDGSKNFSEKTCKQGSLGIILGSQLLGLLAKIAKD